MVDLDGDVVRYVLFSDANNPPTALYYNGTDLNISTNWTSDNTYFYQIKTMDIDSESALSPVFNLTLDTGTPTLTINITNNTFTRFNQTFNFALEDLFPYNLTIRVYRGANTFHTNTSSQIFGRFINLTLLLNLTEDGNYTIEINGSDSDKTSPKIDGILTNTKKGEAEYVMNDTLNRISFKMLVRFEDKNENELVTPTNYRSYANYNSKGTHINFGMNFTSNRNIIIPVYEVNTENVNINILNDSIKGHLVWHPYGTDFDGILLINGVERNYAVSIKRLTSTRVKVSIIPATDINNNDVVQFRSESIFGLNLIDITNNYVQDTKAPTFVSAYNRTADSSNSTTITTATNVNITIFGLDDLYLSAGNFSHNASGSWTNQTITIRGNQTPYHYIIGSGNFTVNQVVGWKFYAYDTAGNQLDPIYTFTVGSIASSSSGSSSNSGGGGGGAIGAVRQCKEYSLTYKKCYYFDGISQCIKGCKENQKCNAQYECEDIFAIATLTQTNTNQIITSVTSPISRFYDWVKQLLGLSKINPELSTLGSSTPIVEAPTQQITQNFDNIKESTKQAFQQNKWLPYVIIGIVITGFGIYVFGLWQTPIALLMGLGVWGYIIIFILLIIIYMFFKYF